ncbi:condensation domain-containing protein [Nocardia sp. NPDC005978]|uniref:condensation domain-containing protein n=1 Tax=Nocardia sp. NPDC005978 TaxID=3156725 RepID=UPI0033A15623
MSQQHQTGSGAPDVNSDLAETIAHTWARLLGVAKVSVDDNFFALGGDSLTAAHAAIELSRTSGLRFTAELIMGNPTINELMVHQPVKPHADNIIRRSGARFPLTLRQRGLRALPGNERILTRILVLSGTVDHSALRAATAALMRRHSILRAVVEESNGRSPAHRVRHRFPAPLSIVTMDGSNADAAVEHWQTAAFDPERTPLLITLTQLDQTAHVLVLQSDRLVADEVSMDILVRELGDCYTNAVHGVPADLSCLDAAYPVLSQSESSSHEDIFAAQSYWAYTTRGLSETPADAVPSCAPVRIAEPTLIRLRAAAEASDLEVHDVLHACLAIALNTFDGTDHVVAVSSRLFRDKERTTDRDVGPFTPLRAAVFESARTASLQDALIYAKTQATELAHHLRVPLEYLRGERTVPTALLANHLELHEHAPTRLDLPGLHTHVSDAETVPRVYGRLHCAQLDASELIEVLDAVLIGLEEEC